jgi:hypothetical protein
MRVRDHLRAQFPAITELKTAVLWWKGHAQVDPDYYVSKPEPFLFLLYELIL